MNITAKSRYALKIMMDLADSAESSQQQRHKIATRQGLSVDFMDHITARLRAAKLIASTRGRGGGFKLLRPAQDISLWDIFVAVEDSLYPVKCMDEQGCHFEDSCIAHGAWSEVFAIIHKELAKTSLGGLVAKWQARKEAKLLKEQDLPDASLTLAEQALAMVPPMACHGSGKQARSPGKGASSLHG